MNAGQRDFEALRKICAPSLPLIIMTKPSILPLTTYRPDFKNRRVQARILKVLEFCKGMLIQKRAKRVSSAELAKVFGSRSSELSMWLRHRLLLQEGTYKPGKKSYSYVVKRERYIELAQAIGLPVQTDLEIARELYGQIAAGAVKPEYTEPTPGGRRFHGIQNLPRLLRAALLAGWIDYDIEAAAPTLTYQLARRRYLDLYQIGRAHV